MEKDFFKIDFDFENVQSDAKDKREKVKQFTFVEGKNALKKIELPSDEETVLIVSKGNVNIMSVLMKFEINKLVCSTFRIGKKQIEQLQTMNIKKVIFVLSDIQRKSSSEKYDYFGELKTICKKTIGK